jgi:D-alanyl-D-alanine carboxypeptidase
VVAAITRIHRRSDPPAKGSGDDDYVGRTRLCVASDRRILMSPRRVFVFVGVAAAVVVLAATAPADAGQSCSGSQIRTASGCTSLGDAGKRVKQIVRETMAAEGLRAALVRVDVRNRTLVKTSPGVSITGVPANLRMQTRIGSIAIPYVIDILFQLRDAGRLSLDDPLSKYLPGIADADKISLLNLATATSGLPDWIQENPSFLNDLYGNPFQQFTTDEILDIALQRQRICEPGECFHYAHTNFVIIGKVVSKVTGKPLRTLLQKRILRPLGLRETHISALPEMPRPYLNAYTAARGPYEDSTAWTPSWGISSSLTMSSTIGDVVKAAKAMGRGTLLSRRSAKERFAPYTAELPGFNRNLYYGLGVIIENTWAIQNPELNGYTAIQGWLPSKKMAVGLAVTKGPRAAAQTGENYSELLFAELTDYLSPDHPFNAPGITPPEPILPRSSG